MNFDGDSDSEDSEEYATFREGTSSRSYSEGEDGSDESFVNAFDDDSASSVNNESSSESSSVEHASNYERNRGFNFDLMHFGREFFNNFAWVFPLRRPSEEPEKQVIVIDDDDGPKTSAPRGKQGTQRGQTQDSTGNDDSGDVQIIEHPSEVPSGDETLVCPICYNELQSPAALPCGHVFCFRCIRKKLDVQTFCPLCLKKTKPSKIIKLFI